MNDLRGIKFMRLVKLVILPLFTFFILLGCSPSVLTTTIPKLYINEFMASNNGCCADEFNENDDWIEIYNPGFDPVNIGGMYISDNRSDLGNSWQIPTTAPDLTTIQPGGFLVLWADRQVEQGVLHVNIRFLGSGEDIVLVAPNAHTIIDSYTFGTQTSDVSMGRKPDGSDDWVALETATPGASNNSNN